MSVLSKDFYARDPEVVARELLGKRLVRKLNDELMEGIIVETEAYYGAEDPASRASKGLKPHNKLMFEEPGRAFIYNVHNNWMFNIVAHKPGEVGAVLIRAVQPIKGIDIMKRNRPIEDITKLTSGPGRLTKAMKIDKSLNGVSVTSNKSEVYILSNNVKFKICRSHRIGVREDMQRELRFFIKGNPFVSR